MPSWKNVNSINLKHLKFLDYIISKDDICMDPCKVQTIVDWITLACIWNIQCFLRFANFYWCFIAQYSTIVAPFTHLTWKDQPFSYGVEVENAFQSLKAFFTIAPLFIHVNPTKPFVLETYASNFALGAILSQHGKDNLFHLSVFVRS
jgi:hypothetical protein